MNPRVLIADDDPIVCQVLGHALRQEGFEVEVVHHGRDALRVLASDDRPSMVLLDWQMPELDGLEVCRRLRAEDRGAALYVCMISGRRRTLDVLQGLEAGADEFISKPFDPRFVASRMKGIAQRRQGDGSRESMILGLLREAAEGVTGEVVVRSGDQIGRVSFYRGKVVWVHLAGDGGMMPCLMSLGVAAPEVRRVFEQCQEHHLPFMDTLVSRGVVPHEVLHAGFRHELSSRLRKLLAMPLATTLLVSGSLSFESSFAYELADLAPLLPTPGGALSTGSPADVRSRLSLAMPVHAGSSRAGQREDGSEGVLCALPDESRSLDRSPLCPPSASCSAAVCSSGRGVFRGTVAESLIHLQRLVGFLGVALVDSDRGVTLGKIGGHEKIDIDVAAASNAEVVRAKRATLKSLDLEDEVEDILITLGGQYHLIRPLQQRPEVFFYVALDRATANLAMARMTLACVESSVLV